MSTLSSRWPAAWPSGRLLVDSSGTTAAATVLHKLSLSVNFFVPWRARITPVERPYFTYVSHRLHFYGVGER
jgi:hypothetical protein